MIDRLQKKFAQPIHPSTTTALPLPTPSICSDRKFQTRTRTRNPGLTFPKPENPGLQKEPGFGNSTALSWLKLVIVQDIWTFDKVVLISRSWLLLEAQDAWTVKSSICYVNLSLVNHQGRYTLPRELLLIFLKWTDSWLRQIEDPSTRIILLLLFLGVNTRWS